MTGVSVICLLFPSRPEEEKLRGRTKGGKNHNFEQRGGEENDYPSSFRSQLLPFFPLLSLFPPRAHPLSLSLSLPVLLVSRETCGRDGRDGGVGQSKRMKNE